MRVDDLRRELNEARDLLMAADPIEGRHATDVRVRRHRVQRTGLAVALVIVLIGGGVFLATRGTDDQRVFSGPSEVPHLLPEPLPGVAAGFRQFPVGGFETMTDFASVVWTDADSALPELGVNVITLSASVSGAYPTQGPVVGQAPDGRRSVFWTDRTNSYSLMARGVDQEALDQMQASVAIDGQGRLVATPPGGFSEVDRIEGAAGVSDLATGFGASTGLVDPLSAGYLALFVEQVDSSSTLAVSTMPRSRVWGLALSVTGTAEVRGHEAYQIDIRGERRTATTEGSAAVVEPTIVATILVWWEDDDTVVTVVAPSANRAHEIAESLREVDDATWDTFVASVPATPTDTASVETFSSSGTAIAQVPTSTVTVP